MGVKFHVNRLCIFGGIVASQQWGACSLCILHATALNDLLKVCTLIQVDGTTFADNMHSVMIVTIPTPIRSILTCLRPSQVI